MIGDIVIIVILGMGIVLVSYKLKSIYCKRNNK
jgi:hypothetical protein